MWRDVERICAAAGLPFQRPEPFPQPSLLAARVALALEGEARAEFSRKLFAAEFGEGLSIAHRERIAALIEALGLDPDAVLAEAESDANKARLKAECARALEIGVFGAPTLVAHDGELFWGDDRLEQGLDWAAGRRR